MSEKIELKAKLVCNECRKKYVTQHFLVTMCDDCHETVIKKQAKGGQK